jgi:hypothetical protein
MNGETTMKELPKVDVGLGYLQKTLFAPIRSKLPVAAIESGQ